MFVDSFENIIWHDITKAWYQKVLKTFRLMNKEYSVWIQQCSLDSGHYQTLYTCGLKSVLRVWATRLYWECTDNQRKSSEKVDWICNYLLILYRYSNICPGSLLRVAVCAESFLEKWLVILLKRAVNKSWESLTRHYWRNKQQSDQCKILSDGVPIGSGTFATILGGITIWNP